MIINKLTEETRDEILSKAKRCTEATLAAFGIDGYPLKGSGCLGYLSEAGFDLIPLLRYTGWKMREIKGWEGNYFIITHEHAMALRNGILVDTEQRGFDNRRIEYIWLIEPKGLGE